MALAPDIRADLDAIFGTARWVEPSPIYAEPHDHCFRVPQFRCEGCRAVGPIGYQFRTKTHRFCPRCAPDVAVASTDLMLDTR